MKICRENLDFVKVGTEYQAVYMKTQAFFLRRWQRHVWHNDEQNILLLWYDNSLNICYIVDRQTRMSNIKTRRSVAFPC